jgi:hypothetical protein
MSSVTRFLRQIPTGLNYVDAGSASTVASTALDFIPTSGNYVGNYPPGFLVNGSNTGLSTSISDAISGNTGGAQIVRDMGKTIFAPFATSVGNGLAGTFTGYGYFRQYQVLMVKPITAAQGFLGGVNGNTFGVVGPAPATAPGTSTYVTFYLPVSVQGVGAPASSGTVNGVYALSGGQM